MFYLNSTLNFGILPALVFQLEVYYKVDRLLTGLNAQQKGTTARWYSNKTSLICIFLCFVNFSWKYIVPRRFSSNTKILIILISQLQHEIESFHRSNHFHFAVYWSNHANKFSKKRFRKKSCRYQE